MGTPGFKAISSLTGGAAFAQLLGLAATPFLTRIYGPTAFGVAGLYLSTVALISSFASGRYDAAIILPEETHQGERDAVGLTILALCVSVATSSVCFLLIVLSLALSATPSWLADLGPWVAALPLSVLVVSISQILRMFATRHRRYAMTARVAPAQRILSLVLQLGIGIRVVGDFGLMLGTVIGPFAGLFVLTRFFRAHVKGRHAGPLRAARIGGLASKYRDFPLLNAPFNLLNAISWSFQALVLASFYSTAEVGQYALASTVVGVPTTLLAAAVAQYYARELSAQRNAAVSGWLLTRRTLVRLMALSLPIFGCVIIFSTHWFPVVFGSSWALAGQLALAITPLAWSRFVLTALTTAFEVYRRQGMHLVWQLAATSVGLMIYIVGGACGWPILTTVLVASGALTICQLVQAPLIFMVIKSDDGSCDLRDGSK